MRKASRSPSGGSALQMDRRSEEREHIFGQVILRLDVLSGRPFYGRLIDISPSGFRAVHPCKGISSGELVHFRHEQASGMARVIWRRIAADDSDAVESGFFVISSEPPL
jgi:hypothetical protein